VADEPVHHVLRPPIPWRPDEGLTECGLTAASYPTWTRDELFVQARKLGKTRTYMVTCVTCLDTAQRHPTFEEDPSAFLGRLTQPRYRRKSGRDDLFARELRAIAALVAAHRDEFEEAVTGLASTTDLTARRSKGARRG
jgi:hypothetical protein